ncbi:hypothetical protein [Bacillus sp. 3255]|uniref:hypothetical protein n=1 Tax=Bacillus sp. 3255 TaxID=2817904 RepID=UPI0028604DC4|nr:hypothetical protein [Bacillus sp. 3255]MDR6883569.1 hypothetical protein [Bacillus sp. 3255]
MKNTAKLRDLTGIAAAQKAHILAKKEGGYTPALHDLYRVVLPVLVRKYGGRDARDALVLLAYLHAYTNGQSANDYYMWAFPTNEQIKRDTGIHQDRHLSLKRKLVDEQLLIIEKIPWNGNIKDMYLPLYYGNEAAKEPQQPKLEIEF